MTRERETARPNGRSRGQLVLVMAVVITVALVPITAAYLQLGYVGETSVERVDTANDVDRAIVRAVSEIAHDVAGEYAWENRMTMVADLRQGLEPRFEALRTSRRGESTGIRIAYNQTDASAFAATTCPSGPGRQFGRCEAQSGVVVQERDGDAVVVGLSLDVDIVQPDSTLRMTRRYIVGTR